MVQIPWVTAPRFATRLTVRITLANGERFGSDAAVCCEVCGLFRRIRGHADTIDMTKDGKGGIHTYGEILSERLEVDVLGIHDL